MTSGDQPIWLTLRKNSRRWIFITKLYVLDHNLSSTIYWRHSDTWRSTHIAPVQSPRDNWCWYTNGFTGQYDCFSGDHSYIPFWRSDNLGTSWNIMFSYRDTNNNLSKIFSVFVGKNRHKNLTLRQEWLIKSIELSYRNQLHQSHQRSPVRHHIGSLLVRTDYQMDIQILCRGSEILVGLTLKLNHNMRFQKRFKTPEVRKTVT